MKKTSDYKEAFGQLEQLVSQLEKGDITLEKLADKVKQADELITICENKLRDIESDIEMTANSSKTRSGKRKKN